MAHLTVVCSHRLDFGSETELWIKVKELLFDNAYLSKVVDDDKSWFTGMEVLDLIHHQFFFTTNSLGHQPTTSQYFQPLALQTLVLAATAIHCVLSECASQKKATVMFSQDEYRGTFGPSPVINFTLEAIALSITHQRATSYPPCSAPQSASAFLIPHWCSSILVGTPQPRLKLFYFILESIPPLSALLILSIWIGAPLSHSALYPPISVPFSMGWELLNSHRRFYNAFRTPYPPLFRASLLG